MNYIIILLYSLLGIIAVLLDKTIYLFKSKDVNYYNSKSDENYQKLLKKISKNRSFREFHDNKSMKELGMEMNEEDSYFEALKKDYIEEVKELKKNEIKKER